jgi:hypothetical protein
MSKKKSGARNAASKTSTKKSFTDKTIVSRKVPFKQKRNLIPQGEQQKVYRQAALQVLSRMRHGMPYEEARESVEYTENDKTVKGLSAERVRRYVGSALTNRKGVVVAKPSDNFTRYIEVPTSDGKETIAVRGSVAASRYSRYYRAMRQVLSGGSPDLLDVFQGKTITSGSDLAFVTDTRELSRLYNDDNIPDSVQSGSRSARRV